MTNYQNSKIYKIMGINKEDKELIYIGSTTQKLCKRLSKHKSDKDCSSKIIFETCDNYSIILIEDYPCNSKNELLIRERYFYELYDCINISKPILFKGEKKLYNQERYINNIEKYENYRLEHKEYQHNYDKEYWEKNKIKLTIKNKEYYKTHIEEQKAYRKSVYEKNKDQILIKRALYREKNKDEINRKQKEYHHRKKEQKLMCLEDKV